MTAEERKRWIELVRKEDEDYSRQIKGMQHSPGPS